MEMTLQKIPPSVPEFEQSVLASCLWSAEAACDVTDSLLPEHFYNAKNRIVFETIREMVDGKKPISLVTVVECLKTAGKLGDAGGAVAISEIHEVPAAPSIEHYCRVIREKWALRRLIEESSATIQACFGHDDPMEIIDSAQQRIVSVAVGDDRGEGEAMRDIIPNVFAKIEEAAENPGMITGVPSGFSELDMLTVGFQPSDLVLLAARPSMGKTAMALNIARNAAVDGGVPVGVFSLEMSREQLAMRQLASESRVNMQAIRAGRVKQLDWNNLTTAANTVSELPIFINDTGGMHISEIRQRARRWKKQHDIGLLIIDYIGLAKGDGERQDLRIGSISSGLKALAKELYIPVLALSQLSRKVEERADKRPMMSDLRDSGSLEQDADVVMFIYRDEVYDKRPDNPNKGKAELIIAKQRNGPTGFVPLAWLDKYTRFENLATDYGEY